MKELLKNIAVIGAGQGAPQGKENYCDEGIPFIKAGNLQELIEGKNINFIQKVSEGVVRKYKLKKYPKGTILFAKSGMSCMKGYVYVLPQEACVVSHLACITPKLEVSDYLRYYFLFNKPNTLVKDVSYPSISLQDIGELKISIKTDLERNKIVGTLKCIENNISMRKNELRKYDELIKARFVEMFGDPQINEKGFTKASMGEYLSLLTDFSSNGSYKALDSGVTMYDEPNYAWMVRTTDLESGDMSSIKYIDKKAYELLSKSKIFGGEIIMNKIGSAGKIYIMPKLTMPASLGRNAFMFRYDERINNIFMYYLLTSDYGQREIQQYVRGAVTKTITKDDARSVLIIVPPLELQQQFAGFVQQVDKSKFRDFIPHN